MSLGEAAEWNVDKHSTAETPTSVGDIGFYSALDYPTLFIDDFKADAVSYRYSVAGISILILFSKILVSYLYVFGLTNLIL